MGHDIILNMGNNPENDTTFFNIWDLIEEQYNGIRINKGSDGRLCVVVEELQDPPVLPLPQEAQKFQLKEVADNIYIIPTSARPIYSQRLQDNENLSPKDIVVKMAEFLGICNSYSVHLTGLSQYSFILAPGEQSIIYILPGTYNTEKTNTERISYNELIDAIFLDRNNSDLYSLFNQVYNEQFTRNSS